MFVSMAALAQHVTKSFPAAILSAIIFVFGPLHAEFIVHLHVYLLAGLPLAILSLLKLSTTPLTNVRATWCWWSMLWLAVLYQALNDPHTLYFTVASLGAVAISTSSVRAWIRSVLRGQLAARSAAGLALTSVLGCSLIYWSYSHYLDVSQTFNYTRSIRDAAHISYSLNKLVSLELLWMYFVCVMVWWRSRRKITQKFVFYSGVPWLIMAILGITLSLGPVMKIDGQTLKLGPLFFPLPYALAYYIVPGFQAMRAATRWLVVANLGMAMIAAVGLAQSHLKPAKLWLVVGLITAGCWLLSRPFIQVYPVTQFAPSIYHQLARLPDGAVAEFPIFHWDMPPFSSLEAERLMYQTIHRHPLYNGITGFTPPQRLTDILWLWQEFPSHNSLKYLRHNNVSFVVVHFDQYHDINTVTWRHDGVQVPSLETIRSGIQNAISSNSLKQIICIESACVYSLP